MDIKDLFKKNETCYFVSNYETQSVYNFSSMEDALKYYDGLGKEFTKKLDVFLPRVTGQRIKPLMEYNVKTGIEDVAPVDAEALNNPEYALAYSKSMIYLEPHSIGAWQLRDDAEKKLGITDRVVDHSDDLLVGYWRVHIVPPGGRFGDHKEIVNHGKPIVEFYDIRHFDAQLAPYGFWISRNYLDDFMRAAEKAPEGFPYGFNLHPQIPNQTMSAEEIGKVIQHLRAFLPQKEKVTLEDQIKQAGKQQRQQQSKPRLSIQKDYGRD